MKPCLALTLLLAPVLHAAAPAIKVLIIDGQNNHDWKTTTPILKKILESSGKFQVDVATSPPKGEDMSGFKPNFSAYKVVLSNYSDFGGGGQWPDETKAAFEAYVRNGGGFVSYHAADNAFPTWQAYNEMIGLGGWGGRTEKSGAYIHFKAGNFIQEAKPGPAGHHGKQHEYQVAIRNQAHPITKGLPQLWMHTKDELYDSLRGPATNMHTLATAFSDPETGGSGENEPVLMVINYGNGRVFHTVLGHGPEAMADVGFIVTLQRGTEWAATGKVTQKPPADFPAPDHTSVRE
jgi:type 1 glutamine amidotransferase